MPVNKKDNKKNAPVEKRNSHIVPTKEEGLKQPIQLQGYKKVASKRIDSANNPPRKKKK